MKLSKHFSAKDELDLAKREGIVRSSSRYELIHEIQTPELVPREFDPFGTNSEIKALVPLNECFLNFIPPRMEREYLSFLNLPSPVFEFFRLRRENPKALVDTKKFKDYLLIIFFVSLAKNHKNVYLPIFCSEPVIHGKLKIDSMLSGFIADEFLFEELVDSIVEYSEFKVLVQLIITAKLAKQHFKLAVERVFQQGRTYVIKDCLSFLKELERKEEWKTLIVQTLTYTKDEDAIRFYRDCVEQRVSEAELDQILKALKEPKLRLVYRHYPFIITERHVQYFVDKQYYHILLLLDKAPITEYLAGPTRFRKVLSDFQRGIYADYIIQIIYKAKGLLTYEENLRLFYKSCLKIFESESTKSALYLSRNPLNFALMMGILLKRSNKQMKLKSEDYKRLALKYIHLAENIVKVTSDEILRDWISSTDALGKNFLDYCFKIYSDPIVVSRQVQYAVGAFWHQRLQYKLVLAYLQNTFNFRQNFLEDRLSCKREIKRFKTRSTHSGFKFSIYRRSVMYRVFNQLVNLIIIEAFEVAIIFLFDQIRFYGNPEPGQKIFLVLAESYPVIFYIACYLRLSYFIQIVSQALIYQKGKEKIGIYKLDMITLFSLLVVTLIFFLAPLSGADSAGGFLLVFFKDSFCYLLAVKFFYLLLPTPFLGKSLRIFSQLLTQLVRFLLFSLFFFTIVALVLQNVYLLWHNSFNGFPNVFDGVMQLYSYTFGSVAFNISEVSGYMVSMNIILIIVSFFGNFLLFNIMTTVFSTSFNKIYQRAFYLTSKSQYEFFTVFPHSQYDGIYHVPFCLQPFFLPLTLPMMWFEKWALKINFVIKVLSHVLFVSVVVLAFLIVALLAGALVAYLDMFINIFSSPKRAGRKLWLAFAWVFYGPFLLLYSACFDFANSVVVICDYALPEPTYYIHAKKELGIKTVHKWDFRSFYKKTKEINATLFREITFAYAKYFYLSFKLTKEPDLILAFRQRSSIRRIAEGAEGKVSSPPMNYTKTFHYLNEPIHELNAILKKFRMADGKVNLLFIEKYLRYHKNLDIHNIKFMFSELENAMFLTIYDEEKDIQASLQEIDEKIEAMVKQANSIKAA